MTYIHQFCLALLALPIACVTMSVFDESSPGADLGSLSVFAWEGGRVVGEELIEGAHNGLVPMIEEILLQELAGGGFRRDRETADFRVSFLLSIEQAILKTTLRDFDDTPRGRFGGGGAQDIEYEYAYDEGTLAVELRNVEDSSLIWRGWAEAAVDWNSTHTERRKRIREAISRILDRLPSP